MTTVERRVRRSGIIVAAGLVIELLSLIPIHALAFIGFAVVGVPVIAAGVVLFLLAVVSQAPVRDEAAR